MCSVPLSLNRSGACGVSVVPGALGDRIERDGLEVGSGAGTETGGLLVEEAGRGQVLGGQAE